MSIAETPPELARKTMTVEEFLALPDDGIHRELILGEVREEGITYRNRFHSRVMMRIGQLLGNWLDTQPEPRGELVGGEAGFRLKGTKDSLVGIDVAYVSPEMAAAADPEQRIYDGPPTLAVEILSPSDTHEDITDKIRLYLGSGVPIVWVVDPDLRTVRIHRPGRGSEMVNDSQELTAEPELPGFRVVVAKLFGA